MERITFSVSWWVIGLKKECKYNDLIGHSKTIPSLWNSFKITYDKYDLFIRFNVLIETKSLGIFNLVPNRLDRLELMNSLSDEGKSTSEIRDYLNSLGYLKIRTKTPYSIKDVNMGILKYRRRLKRKSYSNRLRVREELVVTPLKLSTGKNKK